MMGFRSTVPSHIGALSLQQALELSNIYLKNAYRTKDHGVSLVLCHDAEAALSQAKSANKKYHGHPNDAGYQALREGVAAAYIDLGKLMEVQGYQDEAQTIYKKAEKWGGNARDAGRLAKTINSDGIRPSLTKAPQLSESARTIDSLSSSSTMYLGQRRDIATIPSHIFAANLGPAITVFKLPDADERLSNTPQLVHCLSLLQASRSNKDMLELAVQKWLRAIENDTDEQERLRAMVIEVVRAFKRDEIKDAKAVAEVVYLAPVLDKDSFQDLLREFYSGIDHSGLLNFHQLEGLAQLIQGAEPGYLSPDDLVKILELLSTRLRETHRQSSHHIHQLTLAVSHVLDAMADTQVTGLDREKLHEPLSKYLSGLRESPDPFLVYQAAYAYQALLCVPDNETLWQAAMRRTGKVIQGISGMVTAVKSLDLVKFIEGLEDIQKGIDGASMVVEVFKTSYEGVASFVKNGQGFLVCLKEGLSFERKRDWYSALRGADELIRNGEFAVFRKLVCEAPCRYDPAFQWGVCQRLGEVAANTMWDPVTRASAVGFLGEIYRNDDMWGQEPSVKQWVLNILMQLDIASGSDIHPATIQLQELEGSGDAMKQAMYQERREQGPVSYPLKTTMPELGSPSLLDRVQNRPDVESSLRMLRKQRTKERGNAVYIQPQAKASFQAPDDTRFPLMGKVKEFLNSGRKVFLLLGDSGAGKSTFSRELEFELWKTYKSSTDRIPLHINLPAIDKPEHDMIVKQLRKAEFTEPQIREMKHHRKFILICDGYDESQQTHNLYMSNQLNQPGEWDVQMVISCRSEYLGTGYRDRFQPGNRNQKSGSLLFQEAVVTPFSFSQVQDYIQQYVSANQPLWRVEDYRRALELIPSLKELVKNPFLMTLSLEVLPRMVDPGQHLSTTRVTRVTLYDHFVEQWLERGKRRLAEKDLSPRAKEAFERLSAEGFTLNGIGYLKRFAVAIYKEQDGHPVVEYSQLLDEGTWKDTLLRETHKQLLLEASPMTRNGNQHRFIHRSILEYGLARAVFDPQDKRKKAAQGSNLGRRSSVGSTLSFEDHDYKDEAETNAEQESDFNMPLVWRSFVNDFSLLQFLEERVQQEPVFKEQLFAFIERSKKDRRWRIAAANAITILVRAGIQFIGTDLRGIQIPGADLSYGVFDSAQMQDADLRKVNLRGVWLRKSDLGRSHMAGVQFGEMPYLTERNQVASCVYSPDGKFLAVGLKNSTLSVYTTSNWERIMTLIGHTHVVQCVIYSPEGDLIASGSRDKTIRVWDAKTGSCLHVLAGHTEEVNKIAYSPQGNMIVSSSDDKTLKLWNPSTADCIQTLSGHLDIVICVAYSPQGHQIASGSDDSTVRLWNIDTGVCSHVLSGHSDSVWDVAYSPQGNQLASASHDTMIRLWNVETGVCQHILDGHSFRVFSITYSPKGGQLASCGKDKTVRLWDVETGACQQTMSGHNESVHCVAYSPKGDQLVSGSADKTVRLWDISAGASRHFSSGHSLGVYSVKSSPNGEQFVSGSADSTIRLWDAETGSCRRTLREHTKAVECVVFSPKGDMIASGSCDNSARLWDIESGTCLRVLADHTDWVEDVAFSPQGDILASASFDKTVRLWNVTSGECLGVLQGHGDGAMAVAFSPDGKWIASGSKDQTVRVWDVGTLVCHRVLKGHSSWVRSVMFSPQGDQLSSAGNDRTIRLWNAETGDCQLTLTGHSAGVIQAAYSPKGDLLASGSLDKTARIWDVVTGQCQAVVSDFQGYIGGIAWSTTSAANYLVTGSKDGSVLKWQVIEEDGQCQVRLCWSATNGALTVTGANIQGVRGLAQLNMQLLKQREAVGEPEHQVHAAFGTTWSRRRTGAPQM